MAGPHDGEHHRSTEGEPDGGTVGGVIPPTATLMNRNDHPQMKASRKSRLMVRPIFPARRRTAPGHHPRYSLTRTFRFIDGWSVHVTQ